MSGLTLYFISPTVMLQRQGCVHGEELDYVFGSPLFSKLQRNFTRQEEHLAEMVLTYWANFITSGSDIYIIYLHYLHLRYLHYLTI